MATFQLGAIVTAIAGSIGGTTLKRNGGYKVMMNKSSGTPYSRSYDNPALYYLPFIFKSWATASQVERDGWNALALTYTFPDKFGTLRNITGRQLFIKLNSQGWALNKALMNFDEVTAVLPEWSIDTVFFDPELDSFTFSVNNSNTGDNYYYLYLELSLNQLQAPTFISRKVINVATIAGNSAVNIINAVREAYPYFNNKYYYRLYVQQVNTSGFKSVMQYSEGVPII
jgi:hypothetical protein